jgi:hypothetical protein
VQETLYKDYPTLMRPVTVRNSRYNQHATTGSLLVEVGTAGNSLEEAVNAARLFAAGFAIGWLICGLFWLRVRVSLARAERKIKRLEHQIAPVSPAAVDAGVPAVKE